MKHSWLEGQIDTPATKLSSQKKQVPPYPYAAVGPPINPYLCDLLEEGEKLSLSSRGYPVVVPEVTPAFW